jgi:uncharacterized membrane protein
MLDEIAAGFRAIMGVVFVFFVPGFAWTFIFFKKIRILERVVLSFCISIAAVTLSILALNLLGIKISLISSFFTILSISAVPLFVYLIKKYVFSKRKNRTQ